MMHHWRLSFFTMLACLLGQSGLLIIPAGSLPGGIEAAHAQGTGRNPRPIPPRGDGPRKPGPRYEVTCGRCLAEAIYDPHLPVTDRNKNHKSLQRAIDNTRPGGKVTVYRDRNRAWLDPFSVRTPNITISAADSEAGGTIVVRQETQTCLTVAPRGGRRFTDVTTTIEGFTFLANDGALGPCIDVRKGTLKLIKTRIDLGESNGVGIEVGPTAALEFSGKNYDEHGIFAGVMESTLRGNPRNGTGIIANASKAVRLTGIRLQGLAVALDSRAEVNALTGARFFNNGVGVTIEDAAIASAYAPGLVINGGAFTENGDAIRLTAGGFGPVQRPSGIKPTIGAGLKAPTPSANRARFSRPFRGRVLIKGEAKDKVRFERNLRGISFDDAYPTTGFRVERAEFSGHQGHALQLNLPRGTEAILSGVDFNQNAVPIVFANAFDGDLVIADGSFLFGSALLRGIAVEEGRGSLNIEFDRVVGARPVFVLGEFFDGTLALNVSFGGDRHLVYFTEDTDVCRASLRKKNDRLAFFDLINTLPIFVNNQQLALLFGEIDPGTTGRRDISARRLRAVQDILCGRVLPEGSPQ